MVARSDLAVAVGFERMSEVQEEILRLCEAAHVRAIWATQAPETMAKRGIPSRAACVMLNKAPDIVEATRFLSVLARMDGHKANSAPMPRRLAVSARD